MKKIILISILILMFMAPLNSFAASGSILSPWKKSGTNVSLARSTDNVGIGTASPLTKLQVVETSSSSPRGILSSQYSDDTNGARIGFSKARSNLADPNRIIAGDTLGRLMFRGYNGSAFLEMASIEAVSTGTIAADRIPTYLAFSTGTDAAPSVLTEAMRIGSAGNIYIGTTSLGTSATKNIVIGEGTAPTTSPVDVSHVWSQNYNGAVSNRLYERTEEGNSAPIALLSETGPSYGVAWNETTDSYTRLGRTLGHKIAATLPDEMLPIQASMKRCLLKDDGTINYFLYPSNSAFKVDGSTASVLTGVDGQVMVRIPKFWYRYRYIAPVHYWEVSPVKLSDFDVHPAFVKDGVEVDYRYIGAYEGVLYDASISQYVDGLYQSAWSCTFASADKSIMANSRTAPFKNLTVGQKLVVTGTSLNNGTVTVASLVSDTKITVSEVLVDETAAATVIGTQKDYTATTGDKLSSVSGFAPTVNFTRANCRVLASNRGAGWRQLDYSLVSAIQLLWLTEWASFYTQSLLGAGITNVSDWVSYNDYNPITRSGNSNVIGNATGNTAGSTSAATESTKYSNYRGIENWYGHVWKFVDGFNINGNVPYMTNNSTYWADDTASNYVRPNNVLGNAVTLINSDGYPATLLQISEGFLPKTVGASSSVKLTDYYYQDSGWRVALLGGGSNYGAAAGGFCWNLSGSSATLDRRMGGRLSF